MSTRTNKKYTDTERLERIEKKVDKIDKILQIAKANENWCDHEWTVMPNISSTWMPVSFCRKCGKMKIDGEHFTLKA